MLFLLALAAPGILVDRPYGHSGVRGFWLQGLNDFAHSGLTNIFSPAFDSVRFCQLVAKIAHSFATAIMGENVFVSYLPEFIVRTFGKAEQYPECYHLIGGDPKTYAPAKSALHEIGAAFTQRGGKWLLSIHVRFFANLGSPVYVAMVGELANGLSPEQALSRAVARKVSPAHTPDKTHARAQ